MRFHFFEKCWRASKSKIASKMAAKMVLLTVYITTFILCGENCYPPSKSTLNERGVYLKCFIYLLPCNGMHFCAYFTENQQKMLQFWGQSLISLCITIKYLIKMYLKSGKINKCINILKNK